MGKRKALGRGLHALLGESRDFPDAAASQAEDAIQLISIEQIEKGTYQPRRTFPEAAIQELANSIAAQGIIQPIIVRPSGDRYELIAGERRWRAAQLAGLREIPSIVRSVSLQSAAAMALVENIQREDLSPIEEAEALRTLQAQFDLTHQGLAELVGRSRSAVSNLLRLNDLHPKVKELLCEGQIEMGHARALLGLEPAQQCEIGHKIPTEQLSVRQVESLVRRLNIPEQAAVPNQPSKSADSACLERELSDLLAAKVALNARADGSGKIVVQYHSLEELDGILQKLRRAD